MTGLPASRDHRGPVMQGNRFPQQSRQEMPDFGIVVDNENLRFGLRPGHSCGFFAVHCVLSFYWVRKAAASPPVNRSRRSAGPRSKTQPRRAVRHVRFPSSIYLRSKPRHFCFWRSAYIPGHKTSAYRSRCARVRPRPAREILAMTSAPFRSRDDDGRAEIGAISGSIGTTTAPPSDDGWRSPALSAGTVLSPPAGGDSLLFASRRRRVDGAARASQDDGANGGKGIPLAAAIFPYLRQHVRALAGNQ